jgi:antitoxin (DNA-binding transcriptional repressor) of toxin-antitoxin stability system
MIKVSATEAARNFSEIMNRVKYQGHSFDVTRGNETIARILPAGTTSTVLVEDLNEFFRTLPRLSNEELNRLEHELEVIRSQAGVEENKKEGEWD